MSTALTTAEPLFERNDHLRSVTALPLFLQHVETALEAAAAIGRVASKEENDKATTALLALEAVIKTSESGRIELKAPVLDFCRTIDGFFNKLREPIIAEKMRIGTLAGNYHTLLQQQLRAEQALRQKELDEIERRKQEQLAKVKSHEEADAINARAHQEVQAAQPVAEPVRAHRQTVKPDIEFEVQNIDALYRAFPQCVELTPKRVEIKALLKAGVTLPGVTTKSVVKVGVRLPQQQTIDV